MFPTPFTVTHSRRVREGENALGQAVDTYESASRAVFGWSPKSSAGARSANAGVDSALADRTTTEISLLTPDGDWSDGDKVTLPDGHEYTVIGEPSDANHGPFGFTPGYRVTLRRVEDG